MDSCFLFQTQSEIHSFSSSLEIEFEGINKIGNEIEVERQEDIITNHEE